MNNKIIVKEAAVLFAKIFAISTLILCLISYKQVTNPIVFYHLCLSGLATAILWVGSGLMSDLFNQYLSWLHHPAKRLIYSLLATLFYTIVVWYFIATAWTIPTKGLDLLRVIRSFDIGDFLPTLFITTFISVFMHGRSFLYEWKNAAQEAERLKKEQIAAQYETLKNQVNPHFLFNSLNVLTTLVHKDANLAEQFVRQMSAVYRYILESRDQEVVSLADEIKGLESYIFLMKIRFGDSFHVDIQVQNREGKVAPLTLQMLVENAVKHNEVSKAHPLHVQVLEEGAYIVVKNSIRPKIVQNESSGVGLPNIKARYGFLSNQPIEVQQAQDLFTVKIPII